MLRAGAAAGSSTLLGASYLAFYSLFLMVLGVAKLRFMTNINSASKGAEKAKGKGMGKNSNTLECVMPAVLDTCHGLGMSALVAVALP
ncbi:hypothetical protein CXP34_05720 [Ralstonia mannitolilytica]|nr:hypothetical protein CXP34_05720 [Ralstonia mannitolilytica]